MFPLSPLTIIIGVWLVASLLALCGRLPLITALISGASSFILLTCYAYIHQTAAIICAVLVWFILWCIGSAISRRRKRKTADRQKQTFEASPAAPTKTPRASTPGKLTMSDPAVRVVINDILRIAGMILNAGEYAWIVSKDPDVGGFGIVLTQTGKGSNYVGLVMLSRCNLYEATTKFLQVKSNWDEHAVALADLICFIVRYKKFYRTDISKPCYYIVSPETICLPRGVTEADFLDFCAHEICANYPAAEHLGDGRFRNKDVPLPT